MCEIHMDQNYHTSPWSDLEVVKTGLSQATLKA